MSTRDGRRRQPASIPRSSGSRRSKPLLRSCPVRDPLLNQAAFSQELGARRPADKAREAGMPGVFRPKRNGERRIAPVLPVGGRLSRLLPPNPSPASSPTHPAHASCSPPEPRPMSTSCARPPVHEWWLLTPSLPPSAPSTVRKSWCLPSAQEFVSLDTAPVDNAGGPVDISGRRHELRSITTVTQPGSAPRRRQPASGPPERPDSTSADRADPTESATQSR